MIPRPDFLFRVDPPPGPCDICRNAIAGWTLTTFIGVIPVVIICAQCAVDVTKVVASTPAALQAIDAQERRLLAQAVKASVTNEAVKQLETDNATAKRLLS